MIKDQKHSFNAETCFMDAEYYMIILKYNLHNGFYFTPLVYTAIHNIWMSLMTWQGHNDIFDTETLTVKPSTD